MPFNLLCVMLSFPADAANRVRDGAPCVKSRPHAHAEALGALLLALPPPIRLGDNRGVHRAFELWAERDAAPILQVNAPHNALPVAAIFTQQLNTTCQGQPWAMRTAHDDVFLLEGFGGGQEPQQWLARHDLRRAGPGSIALHRKNDCWPALLLAQAASQRPGAAALRGTKAVHLEGAQDLGGWKVGKGLCCSARISREGTASEWVKYGG